MALGSSAPEILLAIIETSQTLGKPPGQLGPSTIVGSAAFNLLGIYFNLFNISYFWDINYGSTNRRTKKN